MNGIARKEEKTEYERSLPLGRSADAEEIDDDRAFFISDLATGELAGVRPHAVA